MAQLSSPDRSGGVRHIDLVLSVVVVFGVAVAQPLLDLLGRNAEFFLARSAPPVDIVALGLLLVVALPLTFGFIALLMTRIHEPTGRVVHAVMLTLLGALLALHVIGSTPLSGLPGWVEIVIALALGALLPLAFNRSDAFRSVLRYGAIAPVAFLGLFLFASSASQLVFRTPALAQPSGLDVADPAPVVFVVFDEFPVASLMDGDGDLQEDVYPNFARLAREGTWFRNAITVQQQTEAALPAILTGADPPEGRLPMAFDHPASLFTLLSDAYDIRATETVTEMCPEYACGNAMRPRVPTRHRWQTLLQDLRIVSGHLFLPDDLTHSLPPIDHSWSNFATVDATESGFDIIARFNANVEADRRIPVDEFVADIGATTDEPGLWFLHALFPHIPWNYLPSGQGYAPTSPHPASKTTGWGDDEWLVNQAYQQHLVQVQYVDTVVGRIIERLEAADMYDEALIVVVADHGVVVRPNVMHRRVATEESIGEVAAVPLFIKVPNQESGGPDDYRAETVDVLPTVADALGIDVPWQMDGISLLADDRPERTESRITGDQGVISFGVDGSEARRIAARKISDFGTDGPFGLAPPGQADLLGTPIADLVIGADSGLDTDIRGRHGLDDVDLQAPVLPVLLRAGLLPGDDVDEQVVIAIGLNGEIVAVTRSYRDADGNPAFYSLLPPDALVDGANDLELLLVRGTGQDRTLHPIG